MVGEDIAGWVISVFGAGFGEVIGVLFISMLPIIELRGAIPVGFLLGLDWPSTMALAIIGNMLPIPFILLFLDKIFIFLRRFKFTRKIVEKLEKKAEKKSASVTKYEFWGLAIFVGIPLPGTGAWTGALIASVLKMPKKKAILSIFIGVLMASVAVTLLTYGLFG